MKKIIEIIKKYKIYFICLGIIMLSIIAIIIQNIERNNTIKVNGNSIEKISGKIGIYIVGEVKNQGVYYLEEGDRLDKLIDVAGGLTESADLNKLNLSQKLKDSDKIVVPKLQDKLITDNDINENNLKNDNQNDKESGESSNKNSKSSSTNLVNINKADKTELMSLNGIGESTAQKIIDYRKNNKFNVIEDIMEVKGIGEAKFSSIKEYICVE